MILCLFTVDFIIYLYPTNVADISDGWIMNQDYSNIFPLLIMN